ncbi:MAG: PRC-barrel domain-containing protein [Methanomicrobia archaeon]|nr:PRC-barrel domain-containing protein [Methanomicrobia archaeon]
MAKIAASRLRDRRVVTEQGHEIGTLFDIIIDEDTGKIMAFIVDPSTEGIKEELMTDKNGLILVPFGAFYAIKDYLIVDARRLPKRTSKTSLFTK